MSRKLRTTLDIASVAIILSLCMAAAGSACGSPDVPPVDGSEIQQDSAWSCTCAPKFPQLGGCVGGHDVLRSDLLHGRRLVLGS